jgi:REP element-mobilizing transposase RayT
MTYDPKIHHRRSIRLQGYDYSQNGAYFITLCAQDRKPIFGKIVNGEMQLNQFGIIARDEWLKTSAMRKNIEIDEFMIMPNHLHGIIVINNADIGRGAMPRAQDMAEDTGTIDLGKGTLDKSTGTLQRAPTEPATPTREQFGKPTSNTIPTIIRGYKAAVTKQINTIQIAAGVYNIPERIWQKNYYEHVIRNEASLNRIREYIMSNPLNWKEDDLHLP